MAQYLATTRITDAVSGAQAALPHRLSLLELLLPDGSASQCLVIGSNCPTALYPHTYLATGRRTDLCVIAPTRAECRMSGWLEEKLTSVASQLAPNGIAYILAPAYWRFRIASRLRNYGLSVKLPILHVPDSASSGYLVPLAFGPARYALKRVIPLHWWQRQLAALVVRLPGAERLLSRVLPSVGLAVSRADARPLFGWLGVGRSACMNASAIVCTSWRGSEGAVILHYMSNRNQHPIAIAKLTLTKPGSELLGEAAALAQLGPGARRAGARVPHALQLTQFGGRPVLIQSIVSGQSAAELLAAQPRRFLQLVRSLGGWLEQWNRSTVVLKQLDDRLLDQQLLAPGRLLAPLIPGGDVYLDWLAAQCAAAAGAKMPLVAAHNDLTMWNVLLDEHGRLGVIDWETARQDAFPLVDFFYAVADAAAAAQRYTNRQSAFEACFAPSGLYSQAMDDLVTRMGRSLGLLPSIAQLCFHGCWLHHAANEYSATDSTDRRPFLMIVHWLASQRPHMAKRWRYDVA